MKYLSLLIHLIPLAVLGQVPEPNEKLPPPPKILNVAARYTASGGMGDATNGTKYVQLNLVSHENPRPGEKECIKVSYTEGPLRWAGTYWLNQPNNWGQKKGDDLSKGNYARISFWVRGLTGNEKVEFKAGNIEDEQKPFKDSFGLTTGTISLSKEWQRKEMSLQGQNLSSVIGAFCWAANIDANPSGVTFYISDIQYEGPN
jgi:hypothetical protein